VGVQRYTEEKASIFNGGRLERCELGSSDGWVFGGIQVIAAISIDRKSNSR
jgi:hypothetical protein